MKRYWSGLVVASALAATAVLGAQGPNPANTPPADRGAQPGQRPQPGPSTQARTPNTVTVTGCIKNAPTGLQPTQRFVLSNGRMTSTGDAGRSAVGTTGTGMTTYQLEGQTPDISSHLNHRVEITGMLQSSNASAAGSAGAAAGSTAAGPTLRVTSVKMLASTCDETPGTSGSITPAAAGTSGSSAPAPPAPAGPADGVPANPEPKPEPNPEPQPRQEPPAPQQ